MIGEFLDTKVSYPPGTPADHQIIGFVDGEPDWRYNPVCYFHDDNVIHHSSGEDESCLLFRFKRSAKQATVILELKGAKLHQGYYTELMEHNHDKGTLVGSQPTHTHPSGSLYTDSEPDHTHGKGTLDVDPKNHNHSQDSHDHPGVEPGPSPTGGSGTLYDNAKSLGISGSTAADGNHAHDVIGNTGAGGGDAVTISGATANAGVTPKAYPDQLKIYIDDADKTTEVLAKTGLTQFGDGTETHAFVTTGSGEMDISDLITTAGIHEIKITEPISAKGGRCLLHLEIY